MLRKFGVRGGLLIAAASLLSCTPPLRPAVSPTVANGEVTARDSLAIAAARKVDSARTRDSTANARDANARDANAGNARAARRTEANARTFSDAELVPPTVSKEFRGVWVASVANIDWPSRSGLSSSEARAELIGILDRAVELRLNAVIFQVRPAADAFYASEIEPWSEYLTGVQGKAPEPFWDPLEVAVREAHARGLELHAWFNPYRARHVGAKSVPASNHISKTSPALVKTYGPYLWMDPGEPLVRQRTLRVILDVVKRYDIDGVHIDDYFYPYQERTRAGRLIEFPDAQSYRRYTQAGGKLSRDDWRRRNVDVLVQELHEGISKTKPWVKFGISPFGIWRPGHPEQIRGLDAYATLYADARKWLREGWLDYFTPQLYWPTTRPAQSYAALLEWWSGENLQRRHLWPGNFTTRTGGTGASAWPMGELLEQIRLTRVNAGATGNVHFSMKSFLVNQAGMNDTLMAGPYREPALVPPTPWLKSDAPPLPVIVLATASGAQTVQLDTHDKTRPWQFVVRARVDSGWVVNVIPGHTKSWSPPKGDTVHFVTVASVNRLGIVSDEVRAFRNRGATQRR